MDQAIKNLDVITDAKLRNCIRNRLEKSGKILIRRNPSTDKVHSNSDDCYKNSESLGQHKTFLIIHSKKITLCIENIIDMGYGNDVWQIILHEFAHSCGWSHGDEKGVPGQHGFERRVN